MAAVEDEQPSSSSSTFSKEEVNKLMSQGKRHFVCDEIVEAVKCFEVACLMLNKQYGVLSNECGEAHFHYGKSLFELARLENGVLGSALDEAVQEELADSDDDSNMDTEGQTGASTGVESSENNKPAETTMENTAASQTNANEEVSAEAAAEKKREEDKTENKTDDQTMEDNSKQKKEEETSETSEEKPVNKENSENTEEKMVEDTPDACKMEAKCSDVAKEKEEKQENDNKHVSEDTSKNNKESTNEENKEKDEAMGDTQDQNKKPEEQKDDTKVEEDKKNETAEQKDNDDIDNKDDEAIDDGPVSTIRLAWETLELARIVFKRHSSTEMQLKLAQTHLLLGEIHMEQEQFQDAVSELTKCLNIQKNLLKPDDRLLAETYYNLGLAYSLSMLYDESANHYGNATEVLELRVKNIKTRIEEAEQQDKGKGKAEDDDPLVKDRKELAELEELLPEIKEKCLDAKNESERLKSNIKMGLESMGVLGSSSSTCSTSCSDKPANDVSHLVRKKRKSKDEEQSTENPEVPTKKPRQEGESSTTQLENGDSKMEEVDGETQP